MVKIILDLCGGTGSWSRPYVDAGYTVYNVTLPENDVTNFLIFQNDGDPLICFKTFAVKINLVYGILAAPDCSHFSFARQNAKTPRNIPKAFQLVKKCIEIIEACALYGNLKFWCLENPKGYLYKILGKPPFKFERWHFGDPGNKITYLWGNFKFPKIKPKFELKDNQFMQSGMWQKIEIPGGYRQKGWDSKKIKRAMTPPGFAKAFFKANK